MYFFHSAENPPEPFSRSDRALFLVGFEGVGMASLDRVSSSGVPAEPLDRGRAREGDSCSRGVVGVGADGEGVLGVKGGEGATVWNVRTGRRSTTDFGALQRLR